MHQRRLQRIAASLAAALVIAVAGDAGVWMLMLLRHASLIGWGGIVKMVPTGS